VKFLVDAQLPRKITAWLSAAGYDAIHTLDLPDANQSTDEQVNDVADREQRVVVTKDADFVDPPPEETSGEIAFGLDREHQQPGSSGASDAAYPRHCPRTSNKLLCRARAGRHRGS